MAASDDNQQVYEDTGIVQSYRSASGATPAELRIYDVIAPQLFSARLLDIGVGAGRTTETLYAKAASYTGIDYSHGLIDAARTNHPLADFAVCDARDMKRFDDASFDVANFSFNGIDYVDHADRLRILAEVHRVLAPGGLWTFSSHNRDYARRGLLPWQGDVKIGRTMVKKSAEALRARKSRRRLRMLEIETPDYALVNDEAHGYSLLTYYISADSQRQQLEHAGFADVAVYDQAGGLTTESPTHSMWLHYACRRA